MHAIFYQEQVIKTDIPKIGTADRKRITSAIELKLATHPELYGIPLRQSLTGYRKLRIGDYRIVFRIVKNDVIIFVIAHRKTVYDMAEKRII